MDPHGEASSHTSDYRVRRLETEVEKLKKEVERLKSILEACTDIRRVYGKP